MNRLRIKGEPLMRRFLLNYVLLIVVASVGFFPVYHSTAQSMRTYMLSEQRRTLEARQHILENDLARWKGIAETLRGSNEIAAAARLSRTKLRTEDYYTLMIARKRFRTEFQLEDLAGYLLMFRENDLMILPDVFYDNAATAYGREVIFDGMTYAQLRAWLTEGDETFAFAPQTLYARPFSTLAEKQVLPCAIRVGRLDNSGGSSMLLRRRNDLYLLCLLDASALAGRFADESVERVRLLDQDGRVLAQWGAGYGCAAVLLGNTVSESVSCGIMLAFAARTPEFAPRPGAPLHPYTRKELYDILWPVEGSRLLASALQAAESSLIPYTLAIYTGSRAEAVAQYGSLKGMALPLLFFPFSVLGALSGLLMPEITRAHTKGDTAAMRRLIFTMLRMTGAFSLAAGAGFVLLGAPLAGFIYRDAKVGRYVQLLGFVAPFMYLESMVDGVLKGLGEQLATFRYSLFDSVFRIAAIWLVVPQYGMMGFLGVMAVSNLMTCGLNMRRMMKQIKKPSP